MEEILASVNHINFDIEKDLEEQIGALPLPFPGMDKSGSATCVFHLKGSCSRGVSCPFRHIKPDRTVVCKHWLRGLCKKGDQCEFLHEYDMSKMPECYFYSRFHACSNKECPFLHIDPESKIRDCPWYDRGFCRHGPNCRHRHTRRVACINYLCGFCLDGPDCKFIHPRFELPQTDAAQQIKKGTVICHYCQEIGHKIYNCTKMPPEQREEAIQNKLQKIEQQQNQFNQSTNSINSLNSSMNQSQNHINNNDLMYELQMQNPIMNQHPNQHPNQHLNQHLNQHPNQYPNQHPKEQQQQKYRPLDQVTCYKCGEKGHYANKCPKGHLAFLSSALKELQSKRDSNQDNQ